MLVYDSSLLDDTTSEPGQNFSRILDVVLDPAMEMCAAAAEEKTRHRPQWDRAVFVLNCWCYLQVGLSPCRMFFSANRNRMY